MIDPVSLTISSIAIIVSIVSAVASVRSARSSGVSSIAATKSATIAEKAFHKTFEPYVIAYLAPSPKESKACHFVIENIGKDPARDIRIKTSLNFTVSDDLTQAVESSFMANGVSFLEPGGERRTFIGFFSDLIDKAQGISSVTVSYDGRSEQFPIDMSSFAWVVKDEATAAAQLKRIADSVEKMAKE